MGYLRQDIANYAVLQLTERARPLLRGEFRLELARPRVRERPARRRRATLSADGPCDEVLFERLRALRKQLADKRGVPPYVIFGDASLVQMTRHKPGDERALLSIHGVGVHKLEQYGAAFLRVIAAYVGETV